MEIFSDVPPFWNTSNLISTFVIVISLLFEIIILMELRFPSTERLTATTLPIVPLTSPKVTSCFVESLF